MEDKKGQNQNMSDSRNVGSHLYWKKRRLSNLFPTRILQDKGKLNLKSYI